ncbi:TPA: oligosaccharide flippase family protein [Vibrio cholerae]|nr:oligosaccharide flippase family protein [Vibrio cholerae]
MKKLFSNIAYLSTIKGVDLLVPLLVMPYVIKVIGLQEYGIFSLSLLYFNFIISFTDFGQSLIAIKDIAKTNNKEEKLKFINQCISIRLMLSFFSIIVAFTIIITLYSDYIWILIAFSCGLIFESLSLAFYYQAQQEMKKIAIIQVLSRLFMILPIFLLVKDPDDLITYCYLHVSSTIISSILIYLSCNNFYFIKDFKFIICKKRMISGWNICSYQMINGVILPGVSTFIASVYTVETVAIFAVIQRILSSLYRVFEPSIIALYPYLATLSREKNDHFTVRVKQAYLTLFLILISCIFALSYFSGIIQGFMVGNKFNGEYQAFYSIMIYILIPMVINLFTTRVLVIIGLESCISKVLVLTTTLITISLLIVFLNSLSIFFVGVSLLFGYSISMLLILNILNKGMKNDKE